MRELHPVRRVLADTVVGKLRDIAAAETVLLKQIQRLRSARDKVLRKAMPPTEASITDHAIIRFMERVDGVDTEAVKVRIRRLLSECRDTDIKGVKLHSTGMQVIINDQGVMVTILPAGTPLGYPTDEGTPDA